MLSARTIPVLIASVCCALLSSTAQADVYKCKLPSGETAYQQAPCAIQEKQQQLRTEPGVAAPSEQGWGKNGIQLYMALIAKAQCDRYMPGFREKSAANWAKFRNKYMADITRIENSPEFRKTLAEPWGPVDHKLVERDCTDDAIEQMGQVGDPPSPQFASPETTWNTWLSALRAADRKAAVACLAGSARQKFKPVLDRLSDKDLAEMAEQPRAIALSAAYADVKEYFVAMKSGHGGMVSFVNANGNWLIGEM